MRKRISPSTIIASLALFFSLTGAGFAAQHYLITSKSQIAPWMRAEMRGARGFLGPRGSQGAQGVQGATGPAGQAGPAGAASIPTQFLMYRSDELSVPAGQQATVTASCPHFAGRSAQPLITGGGFHSDQPMTVLANMPGAGQTSWMASVQNDSASDASVQAWAICEGTGLTP